MPIPTTKTPSFNGYSAEEFSLQSQTSFHWALATNNISIFLLLSAHPRSDWNILDACGYAPLDCYYINMHSNINKMCKDKSTQLYTWGNARYDWDQIGPLTALVISPWAMGLLHTWSILAWYDRCLTSNTLHYLNTKPWLFPKEAKCSCGVSTLFCCVLCSCWLFPWEQSPVLFRLVLNFWGFGKNGLFVNAEEVCPLPVSTAALTSRLINKARMSGQHHAYISKDGRLWTVGQGESGQLGVGDRLGSSIPKQVMALKTVPIQDISISNSHTCALTKKGVLYTFGKFFEDFFVEWRN